VNRLWISRTRGLCRIVDFELMGSSYRPSAIAHLQFAINDLQSKMEKRE